MILPSKHISAEHTLLGIGAILIAELDRPQTVTSLWERTRTAAVIGNFERFVLALDMLHGRYDRGMEEPRHYHWSGQVIRRAD